MVVLGLVNTVLTHKFDKWRVPVAYVNIAVTSALICPYDTTSNFQLGIHLLGAYIFTTVVVMYLICNRMQIVVTVVYFLGYQFPLLLNHGFFDEIDRKDNFISYFGFVLFYLINSLFYATQLLRQS
mmetsp:Transcript_4449/g.7591  ORF Transcript_4449/g.7591 Transcript_4449/m.7591 type:complete len:126 (+) Transcript_4449:263-640(+)